MTLDKFIHRLLWMLVWAPVLFFSALLIMNTLPYYWEGATYGILPEKEIAAESLLYKVLFYAHVGPAVLLLVLPVFQFWVRITKKSAKLHVAIGNIYVWSTLLLVVPTGLYLSYYAKGGAVAQWGFAIQGILLGVFTWYGWKRIRQGRKQQHIEWMVRSFAMATAALGFRLFHIGFFFLGLESGEGYAASQWISVVVNLILGELAVSYMRKRKAKKEIIKNPKPVLI